MKRFPLAEKRPFRRYLLYGSVWTAVGALSWMTFRAGTALGGTANWAGILHPVLFALTVWPVLRCFVRGERWFTIPHAVLLLTYLAMGLGSVHFVYYHGTLPYAALQKPEHVREALLVVVAGLVAYRIGSGSKVIRRLSGVFPPLPVTPPWSWGVRMGALAAIGLSVISKAYLAATGSLGYRTGAGGLAGTGFGSILTYVSWTGLLGLTGVYFYWFRGTELTRGDKVCALVATAALALLGLLGGMKRDLLVLLLAIAIPYFWSRRSAPSDLGTRTREFFFGVGIASVVMVVFAVNPLYRSALQDLQREQNRADQGPAAAAQAIEGLRSQGLGLASVLAVGAERAWARTSIFPFLLPVVDQVPERHDFRGFDRYPLLPAMVLVPRIIWPDKPANSATADFQRRFVSAQRVFSTTPTVYGWTYWELGAAGVLLGMLVLGALAGVVEAFLAERDGEGLAAILLYTGIFPTLAVIEADPFWLLGGIPKIIFIAALVFFIFSAARIVLGRAVRGSY